MTDTRRTKIPGPPWRASPPRKSSNFGDRHVQISTLVPDPARPGQECYASVAKVFDTYTEKAEDIARAIVEVPEMILHLRQVVAYMEATGIAYLSDLRSGSVVDGRLVYLLLERIDGTASKPSAANIGEQEG